MENTNIKDQKNNDFTKSIVVKHKTVMALGFSTMGQILLSYLLCLLFFSLTALVDNLALSIIFQILQVFIIFSFPYNIMWYEGDRDRNLVKYNRINHDLFRGLKVGIISATPAFFAYGLLILAYFIQNQTLYIIYRVLNFPFTNIIMWVTGYVQGSVAFLSDLRWYHTIILIIIPIFLVLPSVIGYNFGYNRISIMNILKFKGGAKKAKKEKEVKKTKEK